MVDLDDAVALAGADPGDMLGAVARMADDIGLGYAEGLNARDLPEATGITAIALCGMGGSAVGGNVARALYLDRLGVPIEVVRSPSLPEWCETRTLVVSTSYSGGTAETLGSFEEASRRGCRQVVIASGGQITARSKELNVPVVAVGTGFQPRAALGLLAGSLLGVLEAMGVIPGLSEEIEEAALRLGRLAEELGPASVGNRAKAIAGRLLESTPVIWGADGIGATAAMRFKCQLNENGKVPAWWSAMSELDHNEVAAWNDGTGRGNHIIAMRHEGEDDSISPRFPLSAAIARDAGATTEEIWAEGDSRLAQLLSLIAVGDWVSVYVGLARGVDPTPVAAIERLKRELAGD